MPDYFNKNPGYAYIVVILLSMVTVRCASLSPYEAHLNQVFLQPMPLFDNFQSMPATEPDEILITGVYALQAGFPDSLPVLQLGDSLKQMRTLYLIGRLHCPVGSIVRVSGKIIRSHSLDYPSVRLEPEGTDCLAATDTARERVNQAYQRSKKYLEKKITPIGSRLKLPDQPDWQLYWLAPPDLLVFRMVTADLMYAATVEWVYDFITQSVRSVYAMEYFKGE